MAIVTRFLHMKFILFFFVNVCEEKDIHLKLKTKQKRVYSNLDSLRSQFYWPIDQLMY